MKHKYNYDLYLFEIDENNNIRYLENMIKVYKINNVASSCDLNNHYVYLDVVKYCDIILE